MSRNKPLLRQTPLAFGPAFALAMAGCWLAPQNADAAECATAGNGSVAVNNGNNQAGCEVTTAPPLIGDTSIWNYGYLVYSQNSDRTLTLNNDITTTVKGSAGISLYGASPTYKSTFDATGKTINLTIENLTANAGTAAGDNLPKAGVGVSHGGVATIGTLNLTMMNLPSQGIFEHYGVVTGSSNNAAETAAFNGLQSKAIFENLNIKMQSDAYVAGYPLLNGIRAIQGANRSSGLGSAGYVEVTNNLDINIDATTNDAIGIYVS